MSRLIRRTMPFHRLAPVTLLVALLAACDGGGSLTGSTGGRLVLQGGTTAGTTAGNAALVGRWFRLLYSPDSAGSVRTSETTLDLRADGTLVRTVVARQLSFGFADAVVSSGTWRANGSLLTITITTVGSGGASPVDTAATGTTITPPLSGNPPFAPLPPIGSGTTPTDTVGTSAGVASYSYRIETTAQGRTLFLNETPFVELVSTQ